jgi:hypothetical protein
MDREVVAVVPAEFAEEGHHPAAEALREHVLAFGRTDPAREVSAHGFSGVEEGHSCACIGGAARGGYASGRGAVDGDIGLHVFHVITLHAMPDICK